MNPVFLAEQKSLIQRIKSVDDEIQTVFNFDVTYTVEEHPTEWLAVQYFNKLNYTLVPLQNIVMLNDEFFSWLALKYIYEFYIKLKYISSANDISVFDQRVNDYIALGRKVQIPKIIKQLKGEDELLKN